MSRRDPAGNEFAADALRQGLVYSGRHNLPTVAKRMRISDSYLYDLCGNRSDWPNKLTALLYLATRDVELVGAVTGLSSAGLVMRAAEVVELTAKTETSASFDTIREAADVIAKLGDDLRDGDIDDRAGALKELRELRVAVQRAIEMLEPPRPWRNVTAVNDPTVRNMVKAMEDSER